MDKITPEKRSNNMKSIKGKNTKPEMFVRKLIFSLGYRYRIHYPLLPSKPDLVFVSKKKVIFVHGCFWHCHDDPKCKIKRFPKSNQEYWNNKLIKNIERDIINIEQIKNLGWEVLTIWECELSNYELLRRRIVEYLEY